MKIDAICSLYFDEVKTAVNENEGNKSEKCHNCSTNLVNWKYAIQLNEESPKMNTYGQKFRWPGHVKKFEKPKTWDKSFIHSE